MKRLLFSFLFILTAIAGWAQEPEPTTFTEGNFKYTVTDEENRYVSVAKNPDNEPSGDIEIPSSVIHDEVEYTVTSIAEGAFEWCSSLTSFSVPSSVTSIGSNAFYQCSIPTFTFEASNTEITCNTGIPCTDHLYLYRDIEMDGTLTTTIKSLTIGANVTAINNGMFSGCSLLSSIDFSAATGLTSIGNNAFENCGNVDSDPEAEPVPNLTTIDLSNTKVTSIGESAFNSCNKLTSITLPGTLQTIGEWAFQWCSSLTSFSVPSSVTSIGSNAFYQCSIPTFTFEASNTEITCNTGIPCTDHLYLYRDIEMDGTLTTTIKSLTIGANVTAINNGMFSGCSLLSSIDFSAATGLTSIGNNAFENCGNVDSDPEAEPVPNLTTIDLSNTKVTSIGESAFNSCNKLTVITLPTTLKTIGNGAFEWCSSLTSFSVPSSVTSIGSDVFYQCSIPTFTFEASNTAITCGSGIPCSNLYLYRNITFDGGSFSGITTLTIGTNVTSIGTMFSSFSGLTSVTVPWLSSPIGLDEGAFDETALANATLWIPGGTGDLYGAADGWKNFTNKDFSSFVVSITGSAHGTLAVSDISSTNNETATTLIDRETDAVFTVTPATGYELETFTVNSEAKTPTAGQYTVSNLLADQTVVAGFTPITYNLTLTLNGGTATNPTTYTIETETFTLNNPTKTGHTFKGWKLNGEGDAMMEVTIAQGSTGHLAYTATWQINKYTITFDSNGGSEVDSITQDYGTTVTAPDDPTKPGYDFAGWTPELPETMPAENMTVTATWTELTYTVSITGGGVSADNMNPKYGDDVVITIAEDEDRTLNTLTVNGEDVTAYVVDGQYTIHNVTGNVVVVATFNATKEFITLAQGVGTFSCAQDLNFTGSGLKAYIAAGYNKSSNVVLLVRVYDIPAGTGLYLKGEAGVTYKIPYSTSQAYYVNMLKANLIAGPIAKTSGDMSNFLLNKVDGEYGFFAPSETTTLGAQKAYLQVPTSFMSGSEDARAISIAFEDDETTNISDFELFTNSNEHLYNLKGQRVEKAGRGLYIKNGKKVVIK